MREQLAHQVTGSSSATEVNARTLPSPAAAACDDRAERSDQNGNAPAPFIQLRSVAGHAAAAEERKREQLAHDERHVLEGSNRIPAARPLRSHSGRWRSFRIRRHTQPLEQSTERSGSPRAMLAFARLLQGAECRRRIRTSATYLSEIAAGERGDSIRASST